MPTDLVISLYERLSDFELCLRGRYRSCHDLTLIFLSHSDLQKKIAMNYPILHGNDSSKSRIYERMQEKKIFGINHCSTMNQSYEYRRGNYDIAYVNT